MPVVVIEPEPEPEPEVEPRPVEPPPQVEPEQVRIASVAAAARTDDALATLRALRDKLAVEVDLSEHPKDLATLAARLMDTLERVEKAQSKAVPDNGVLDELKQRRAARRGAGSQLSDEA